MQAKHVFWEWARSGTYIHRWNSIHHDSFVVVTASEGSERPDGLTFRDYHYLQLPPETSPDRFVASASFTVHNISPFEGGVQFSVTIDWDHPLTLWTDIIILDGLGPFIDVNGVTRPVIEVGDFTARR